MGRQIFISYSRVDTEKVEWIISRLKKSFPDVTIWHDKHLRTLAGEKWWDIILDAIEGSEIFLYLLSNESLSSEYCQAEFAEAQRLERPFIAVQLRDRTKIPSSLAEYQYVDLVDRQTTEDPYDDLVGSIQRLWSEGEKAKAKSFSRQSRTPKPSSTEENPQIVTRDDRETSAPMMSDPPLKSVGFRFTYTPILITVTVLISGLIVIASLLLMAAANENRSSTAQAQTHAPSALSPTLNPVQQVQTLDAQASANAETGAIAHQTMTAQALLDFTMTATTQATVGVESSAVAGVNGYSTATRVLNSTSPVRPNPSAALTDRQQLTNLIRLEEEAVRNGDLSIIEAIYLPNASIRNAETNGQTWPDAVTYYSEKFQTQIICTVMHHHIDVIELGNVAATVSTGSDGTWGWIRENNGCPNPFNNPAGSDLWEFVKDSSDQWRIASFTFNIGRDSDHP